MDTFKYPTDPTGAATKPNPAYTPVGTEPNAGVADIFVTANVAHFLVTAVGNIDNDVDTNLGLDQWFISSASSTVTPTPCTSPVAEPAAEGLPYNINNDVNCEP